MTRHKQSAEDRRRRLSQGCCPIHGIGLGQIDGWYRETNRRRRREYGIEFTLEADGRRDCQIVVKCYDSREGPRVLPRQWAHLLKGESPDDHLPRGVPERLRDHPVTYFPGMPRRRIRSTEVP